MAHLHLPPLYTLLPENIAHRNNTCLLPFSSPPKTTTTVKTMAIQAQLSSFQQNPWLASQESQLEQQRLFMRQNQILKPTTSYQNQEEMEFDQLLLLQTERLRVALQEQRKQHTAALLKTLESKTQLILNQKDQELAAAAQRTAQLQSFLQKLEMEGHAWRRAAEENEAVVTSLNNTLEQLSKDRECRTGGAGQNVEESGENDVGSGADPCKSCNARGVCVLFLPCRHLCTCKACEPLLGFCPVCGTTKKATVEALIS